MPFSPEQLNFFKFSTVVLDEFPVALRKVFAIMWDTLVASPPGVPKWDDSVAVRNMFLAKEGGKTKYVPTNKSIKEWDCTALFEATIFAKTFARPSTLNTMYVKPRGLSSGTFHPSVISPTGNQAETYALALDQLRLLRNTLCHQIDTRTIDKATFDNYILLAKDAFNALGQDSTRIDEIGKLAEEDFPTARLQQLEDELKREKDAAIKFQQIDDHLTKIESQVEDFGSDVKDVFIIIIVIMALLMFGVTDVKTQVEDVGSDVKDVKTEVTDVKADVSDIKQRMEAGNSKDHNVMLGKTLGALNDLLQSSTGRTTGRHNLIVGEKLPGDILLHHEQKGKSGVFLDHATHVFKYTGNKEITSVVARDEWDDDTGGEAEIISGGPGHKHVEVKVTSKLFRGFKFTVDVYGKK